MTVRNHKWIEWTGTAPDAFEFVLSKLRTANDEPGLAQTEADRQAMVGAIEAARARFDELLAESSAREERDHKTRTRIERAAADFGNSLPAAVDLTAVEQDRRWVIDQQRKELAALKAALAERDARLERLASIASQVGMR